MLYAILCYGVEGKVRSLSPAQDAALMAKLASVHEELIKERKLGPHFRLTTTGTAKHIRPEERMVLDGPFAETKEQLLGLYLVDCKSFDEAVETARRLEVERKLANVGGTLEIRPILQYFEGNELA